MQGGYPSGSYPPDPNVPQPPDPQTQTLYPQAQQQAGPTLGQANGEPPGNPYIDQFLQTRAALEQIAQPLKTPLSTAEDNPPPSWLESLATFGLANLRHVATENTRREENYVRHQKNLAIDAHTNDMALKATDAQMTAAGLSGKANLAQLGMQLRLLEFQNRLADQARQEGHAKVREQLPMPTTPEGLDMAQAGGMEQDPAHPRYMRPRLQPKAGGGWEAPAADSPAASALAAVSGGGGTGGAADTPLSGESPQSFARRQTRQAKSVPPQTGKDVTSIDESLAAVQRLQQLAQDPEVQKWIGPGAGRGAMQLYKFGGKIPGTNIELPDKVSEYIQKTSFLNAQATGPLLHGSRNALVWKQIQQHLPKPHDTPKLALDKLRGVTDLYTKNRQVLLEDADLIRGGGADQGSSTTDTATSSTPPSTLGGTAPTAATQPTSLDSLLKKHGY